MTTKFADLTPEELAEKVAKAHRAARKDFDAWQQENAATRRSIREIADAIYETLYDVIQYEPERRTGGFDAAWLRKWTFDLEGVAQRLRELERHATLDSELGAY